MRLDYQIQSVTDLPLNVVMDRILLELKNGEYGIKSLNYKSVYFDCHNGGLTWNFEYFNKLNSGNFEVYKLDNKSKVIFRYRPLSLSELIFVPFLITVFVGFGLANGTYAGCMSFVFIIQIIAKFFTLKQVAKTMFYNVVTDVQ